MSLSLTSSIRELVGSSGVEVFDYNEDFDRLWAALRSDGDVTGARGVIICGIDTPHRSLPDGVAWEPFERHLHALAWASCWRLRHPKDMVQILLIGSTLWGEGSPLGKLGILFEARRADGLPLIGGIKWMREPDATAIQEWLDDETTLAGDESNLFLLKDTIWQGLASSDHHSLSNVLGAFLLRFAVGFGIDEQYPTAGQNALLGLLTSLLEEGHAGEWIPHDSMRQTRPREWISRKLKEVPAVVLLDDMAALWAPVVRGALGFSNPESKHKLTLSTPGFKGIAGGLPERLSHFSAEKKGRLTRDDIIPGDYVGEKDTEFALLLDLRFFGSEEAELEKSFFNGLVSLGEQLPRPASVTDDQWTGFQDDLKVVKTATEQRLRLHDSPPALTLLPRILTLLDPLLPIVIFSSTHRRSLLDPLRGYPNIITSFVKPVFTAGMGNWLEVVENTIRSFREAMEQAAKVVCARRAVVRIESWNARFRSSRTLSPSKNGYQVDIFFDESGMKNVKPEPLCAGGIVMVRSLGEKKTPLVTDNDIWKSLQKTAGLWGWCEHTPTNFIRQGRPPTAFQKKGYQLKFAKDGADIVEAQIQTVLHVLDNKGIIFPFALMANRTGSLPEWMSAQDISCVSIEEACDSTLRRLIQEGLEGLLFRDESIIEALRNKDSTVLVDLATRAYPYRHDAALEKRFGIKTFLGKSERVRYSLQSDDGFFFTAETVQRLGVPWPHLGKISGARGVGLYDFAADPPFAGEVLPRQLHYFADTVTHVALHHLAEARQKSQIIDEFFASGWVVDNRKGRATRQLLQIARWWERGDRINALCAAAAIGEMDFNGATADAARAIARNVSSLKSHEIADLMNRFHFKD